MRGQPDSSVEFVKYEFNAIRNNVDYILYTRSFRALPGRTSCFEGRAGIAAAVDDKLTASKNHGSKDRRTIPWQDGRCARCWEWLPIAIVAGKISQADHGQDRSSYPAKGMDGVMISAMGGSGWAERMVKLSKRRG